MFSKSYKVISSTGLHARPVTIIVVEAKKIPGDVSIIYKDRSANAKSPISILALAVQEGDMIQFQILDTSAHMYLQSLEEKLRIENIIE